jgi:sulfatase modifying factor 1
VIIRRLLPALSLLALLPLTTAAIDRPAYGSLCERGGDEAIWVPAGEALIGDDRGYPEERPSYRVKVPGFWIDRHEVTNAQYARFVAATNYVTQVERQRESVVFRPPRQGERPVEPSQWWHIVKGADWRHPEGPGSDLAGRDDYPVVQLSYADALAYARWAGRSLPSEEQFERAAGGGQPDTLTQPGPDAANSWQGEFPVRNDAVDGHKGLAPVGCYKPNAFGLQDMIGNAWEWTKSWYLPGHGPMVSNEGAPDNPSFDPAQPDARTRVIKGGSFLCAPNYCARYRPAARHAQDELYAASHLGFRTIDSARAGPAQPAVSQAGQHGI